MTYRFNDWYIPERMMGEVENYVKHKIPPGGFLTAVIENDLQGAVGRADYENIQKPARVRCVLLQRSTCPLLGIAGEDGSLASIAGGTKGRSRIG